MCLKTFSMYYRLYVLVIVTLCLCTAKSELTVEQYEQLINNFLASTISYEYANSSRSFVKGAYDYHGCKDGGVYDFIIVGAGVTGSVVANRLSANPEWEILVLEAGGEGSDLTDIPAMATSLKFSDYNWGYKSIPQKNSLMGLLNNQEILPFGKGVGGSSLINAMIYVRGNKGDYDNWAASGCPGWSYEDVLPFFKKHEDTHTDLEDPGYHGHGGSLYVDTINNVTPLTRSFLEANKELNRSILDYNGRNQIGFSMFQVTQKHGRRVDAAHAFIEPVSYRENLKILTRAFVTRMLIDGNSAYGVKYMYGGRTYCAHARKEVILSAGPINSPQLLMLSGIGPKAHLKELGIRVHHNLPVGENLWDHVTIPFLFFSTNITERPEDQRSLIQQYKMGKGIYTTADSFQTVGFINLDGSEYGIPDIENIMRAATFPNTPYDALRRGFNIKKYVYDNLFTQLFGKYVWQSYTILLHPESRGTVKLKSKDPFDFPLIDPRYFTDSGNKDIHKLIASIRDTLKISVTKAMQKYNSQPVKVDLPDCRKHADGTNDYYECLIRHLAATVYHPAGTCKMGPKTDKTAVIGPDMRVHGIKGLRVADVSVIPIPLSVHTSAPAYMIGEKTAHMLKHFWL